MGRGSSVALMMKQKKEEEEKSDTKDATPTPQEPAGGLGGLSGLSGLSGLGGLGSLFGAPSPKSPKPEEEAAKAKEDSEFQLKMLVLGIALVAAGEGVNEAMVTLAFNGVLSDMAADWFGSDITILARYLVEAEESGEE